MIEIGYTEENNVYSCGENDKNNLGVTGVVAIARQTSQIYMQNRKSTEFLILLDGKYHRGKIERRRFVQDRNIGHQWYKGKISRLDDEIDVDVVVVREINHTDN